MYHIKTLYIISIPIFLSSLLAFIIIMLYLLTIIDFNQFILWTISYTKNNTSKLIYLEDNIWK